MSYFSFIKTNQFYMFNVSYMFNLKRVNIFTVQFIIINIPFSLTHFVAKCF